MTLLKRNMFSAIAMKKLPVAVTKGAKKLGHFAMQQLKHPAVGRFIGDTAAIAAASGFNPEVAAPAIAARTAQEGVNILDRTMHRFG